jgi:hypothetical protein
VTRYRALRKHYSGRVLDGPFEGDWIAEDVPYFQGAYQQSVQPVQQYDPMHEIEAPIVYYKWLHGYGAWAWIQPPPRRRM